MSDEFLSLKEAEQHTGKSRSTLRRFVVSITKTDDHPDRRLIQPSVEEVEKLHADNHPFSWLVSKQLLEREFTKQGTDNSSANQNQNDTSQTADLLKQAISMLKTELDQKNKQIAEFQERQRETNFLIQQTTEKLTMLTEGSRRRSSAFGDAVAVDSNDREEGSGTTEKNKTEKAGPKQETIWDRLRKPIRFRK